MPLVLPMRPQLNGGTLGGQRMPTNSAFSPAETERIIQAVMSHRGVTRQVAERAVQSLADRSAKRNPFLEAQWVVTFHAVCRALVEERARPAGLFASVFWIRLYGVLTDLWKRSQNVAELNEVFEAGGRAEPLFQAMTDVYVACTRIRDALSDEELVFTAFLRHVHAHVYQSGFEYSIEPGKPFGNLRTKQMVRTTARHVDIDEAHAIIDRMMLAYDNDDDAIAVAFAKKVWPATQALKQAMELVDQARSRDLTLPQLT
jgi:hypothetical protein